MQITVHTVNHPKIKYKKHTFDVRGNYLGVGEKLHDLNMAYDDEELLAPLWVKRIPEYEEYITILNEARTYMLEIKKYENELSKTRDAKKKKEINTVLAKYRKAYDSALKNLEKPVISAIAMRMARMNESIRMKFVNNMDNFKKCAEALLIGDLSVIEWDNPDNDLVKLRNDLFGFFFSIRNTTQ